METVTLTPQAFAQYQSVASARGQDVSSFLNDHARELDDPGPEPWMIAHVQNIVDQTNGGHLQNMSYQTYQDFMAVVRQS